MHVYTSTRAKLLLKIISLKKQLIGIGINRLWLFGDELCEICASNVID